MSIEATRIYVYLDRPSGPILAGTAYVTQKRDYVNTTFTYSAAYLAGSDPVAISPDLPLTSGSTSLGHLPGAMSDGAPDRWGRNLIQKRMQRIGGRGLATVREIDYLLGVSDLTRQGALRYTKEIDGPFLGSGSDVPKLIELPALLHAADVVAQGAEATDDAGLQATKLLLDAGTASLGGARPKAGVRDGDRLLIAKFPHHSDRWSIMAWEKIVHDLAEAVGIRVPFTQLVTVNGRSVLLLDRFDRQGSIRLHYVSAMSMLELKDGARADYLELAEVLGRISAQPLVDLEELYRRIVFGVAINNTDDHMRNHGLLRIDGKWRLAPQFDVNPNPELAATHATSLNYVDTQHEMWEQLTQVTSFFGMTEERGAKVKSEVLAGLALWKTIAQTNGISASEVGLMEGAFASY